jgi:predicted nucleic acid-binding protein
VKKIYFDSSVYVKAFSKEPGTDVVNQLLQLAYDGRLEILLSVWAINETFAAIDRKIRRKEIASEQEKMIFATFFQDFVTWSESSRHVTFIPLDPIVVERSRDLIVELHVSADDAIHLYTAFVKRCEYLLCDDAKLKRSTENRFEGMDVLDVNDGVEMSRLMRHFGPP